MSGIMSNIKGTVLKEVEQHIQKTINDIKVPDPEILELYIDYALARIRE